MKNNLLQKILISLIVIGIIVVGIITAKAIMVKNVNSKKEITAEQFNLHIQQYQKIRHMT